MVAGSDQSNRTTRPNNPTDQREAARHFPGRGGGGKMLEQETGGGVKQNL